MEKGRIVMCLEETAVSFLSLLVLSTVLRCLQSGFVDVDAVSGVRALPEGFDFGTVYANCRIDASCSILDGNLSAVTSFPDWIEIGSVSTSWSWFSFHVKTQNSGDYSGSIRVATDAGDIDVPVNVTIRESPAPKLSMLVYETPFDRYSTSYPEEFKSMTRVMETGYVNVSYSLDFLLPENYDLVLVAETGLTDLTVAQVDLLKSYVRRGGALVVCASSFYSGSIAKANEIINDFGLRMRDEEYGSGVMTTEFASHSITSGVESIMIQRPSPVEIIPNPNFTITLLARPSGVPSGEGVLALSEANGKLIALGSALWWFSFLQYGEAYDNSRVFLNIFDYVSDKVMLQWSDSMQVNDIAVTGEGQYMAVANSTGIYYFASGDKNPRWWFLESEAPEDFLSAAVSADGEYVVAGQNTGYIYCFSGSRVAAGQRFSPTWKSVNLHGPIDRRTLDMSETGEYVVVGGTGVSLYYFAGCTGRDTVSESATWSNVLSVIDIRAVALSPDGRYVAAGGMRYPSLGFVAFYKDANVVPYPTSPDWEARSSLESNVMDLALSDDGYSVVAVSVNYSTLHYWADAASLGGDPDATWICGSNFMSVDMSYDGSKVLGGGVVTTSVHFWASSRAREGPQTEDWIRLESLHVLDVSISRGGGIIAVTGMFGSSDYRAYFLKSDGSIIAHHVLPQFSPIVAMSGDGSITAIGGPSHDSLYVFGLTLPRRVHNVNTGLNYTSIQEAIDAPETSDGHKISVDEGVYYEHVVLHKSLELVGNGAGTTIIDGGMVGNVVEIRADNVRINGFTVQNSGGNITDHGIYGHMVDGVKIAYNAIRGNHYGLRLGGSESGSIHSNIVSNNTRYGITLISCSGCYVYDNVIPNNLNGIYLGTSNGNSLHDNNVFLSRENGVWLYNSWDNSVYGNNASNNQNSGLRISSDSNNNTVYGNRFSDNYCGVDLYRSHNNSVYDNSASNGVSGICLWESGNNTLFNNVLKDNSYGFGVRANTIGDLDNSVNTSNTIDGRPIYYLKGTGDIVLDASTNAGAVYLIDCSNVTVKDLTLTKNEHGVLLWETAHTRIENVTASGNLYGIFVNNSRGNAVFHSNFVLNAQNAYVWNSTGVWDDGMEGNYWGDYAGTDSDSDGIGDSTYVIDAENSDKYPLMGMFRSYYAVSGYVNVVSNSTVEDFEYVKANGTIVMHVTNMTSYQTEGFFRLTIPHSVLTPPYDVTINNNPVPYTIIYEDATLSTIYFGYGHSTLEVQIIPEFPPVTILLLLMTLTMVTAVFSGKRGFLEGFVR